MFTELFKSLLNHEKQVFACKFHRIKKASSRQLDCKLQMYLIYVWQYGTVVGVARLIHERNDVFSDIVGWLIGWLLGNKYALRNKQKFKVTMIVLVAHYLLFFILKKVEAYDVILSSFPESCNRSSYFDSISHKCKGCGVFQISSDDRLSCECGFGYYPEFNEKSKAIECLRCDQSIQSEMCLKSNLTCEPYDIKGMKTHIYLGPIC